MRIFLIETREIKKVANIEQLKGFIATAVFNNKDIGSFKVTEIDFKLSLEDALIIASELGIAATFAAEYNSLRNVDLALRNALKLHGLLKGVC